MKRYFNLSNIAKVVLFWSVLVGLVLYFQKDELPESKYIDPSLEKNPIQGVEEIPQPFVVERGEIKYEITPLFSYEIWGMIVTQNDNEAFFSRFKKIDPLNTKDFCLIWGDNLKNDLHQNFEFKSIEFMCEWYTESSDAFSEFRQDQLSNNHLLAEEKEIYNQVRQAQPGDQIHFKGYLVSYKAFENGELKINRGTSTVRDDTGNGACETVYLTDLEFVKKRSRLGDWIYVICFILAITSLIFIIIKFFINVSNRLKPEKIVDIKKREAKGKEAIKGSLPPSVTE